MPAFAFSLQRVLDYRRLEEGWARDAFRAAQAVRFEAEGELDLLQGRRQGLVSDPSPSLDQRRDLEACHASLDREEAAARERLAARKGEESRAQEEWKERRVSAEALAKLREAALEEWRKEEERREQADLDEWAVLRR